MVAAACGERGDSRQERLPGRVVLVLEKEEWTFLGGRK